MRIPLDGAMRADVAVGMVLRLLLQTMLDNLEGTRRDLDPEFLHDFRVALRRTRSCLSQLKKIFPAAQIRPYRREFAWLGQVSGPTRDLDVFLLKMRDYGRDQPESTQAALTPLIEFLERRQREEQRQLASLLGSERFQQLVEGWQEFLEPANPRSAEAQHAARPIARVAGKRIRRACATVLTRGRHIDPDTPATELHQLRIECKKLRYLLEFFRSLYDDGDLRPVVKSLKRLQDCLGDFNDFAVQQTTLQESLLRMSEEGTTAVETREAIEHLREDLTEREERERRRFARRFADFDRDETHERLARITNRRFGAIGTPRKSDI
jgi:CHAD domain-containing protein